MKSLRGFAMQTGFLLFLVMLWPALCTAGEKPAWCRNLPRPEYKELERVTSADPWFEVYKVRPGVFAIYEPHQSEEVISYLILGSQKAVLFDTGLGIGNIRKVTDSLTRLPVSVINSHTHNDHVGDNWRFADIYGMDTDFTRTNSRGSKADAQAELAEGQLCGDLPPGFDAKNYATKPFRITHWLHDGDKIDLGDRVLQVVATPGHTPDSIALHDEKNLLLFTGDTFYPGPIFLYRPETDLKAYSASLARLNELAPNMKLLLPAHNVAGTPAGYLPRTNQAFLRVMRGIMTPVPKDGKVEYQFKGFSFLLKQAVPRPGRP
ncbi:MAG: MBL fold metallo-hydrolase [Acidobacteriia bacterium]|nr:MBL fold metallo-hydrolase [Terriglobia bacterium]